MFHFTFDEPTGVLHIDISGGWSTETVEQCLDELATHIDAARERSGRLRLLVEGGDATFLLAARERVLASKRMAMTPLDRIAVVLRSSLDKVHVNSVPRGEQVATFISPSAARTWLLAYG